MNKRTRKRLERILDENNNSLLNQALGVVVIGGTLILGFLAIAIVAFSGSGFE